MSTETVYACSVVASLLIKLLYLVNPYLLDQNETVSRSIRPVNL